MNTQKTNATMSILKQMITFLVIVVVAASFTIYTTNASAIQTANTPAPRTGNTPAPRTGNASAPQTTAVKANVPFDNLKEEQLFPYFTLAEECVKTYFLSTMQLSAATIKNEIAESDRKAIGANRLNDNLIATMPLNIEVQSYLEAKHRYETIDMTEIGYTTTYIRGSYDLNKWEIVEGNLICYIKVDIEYQYSDFGESSGEGTEVQLVFENPQNPRVVDWYTFDCSFDNQVRGYGLDLSDSKNWLVNQDKREILREKMKCLADIEKVVSEEKKMKADNKSGEQINPQQTNEGFNLLKTSATTVGNKMVTYVKKNYNKAQPAPGSSAAKFDDSFAYGCTNFISHSILAGGYPERSGKNGYDNCWFYTNNGNRSSSWTGVNQLYNFLTGGYSTGPKALKKKSNSNNPYKTYPEPSGDWKAGDILQIKYNTKTGYGRPNYGHSTLITGFSDKSGTLADILVTYRTNDNSYGIDKKLSKQYPPAPNTQPDSGGHLYRFIKLDSSRAS